MFIEYTTHYRSIFFLQPHHLTSQQQAWETALSNVYGWLGKNLNKQSRGLKDKLFHLKDFSRLSPGGRPWENQGVSILTHCSADTYPPRLWACRYEHPDRAEQARRWRIDIGLECMDNGSLRVGIQVAYSLDDAHLGAPPAPPAPSVPEAVTYVMQSDLWAVRLGSLRLSATPHVVQTGEVKQLWDALKDPRRGGPVVVVSADYREQYPLALPELAKELAGVAEVYGLAYNEQDEQRHVMLDDYQCYPGAVRIYDQRVDITKGSDKYRHRYFTNYQVRQAGADQIKRWIVRSLVRQATLAHPEAIFAPADIERAERAERLVQFGRQVDELRSASSQTTTYYQNYSALLDRQQAELKEIIGNLEQRNQALQDEVLAEAIQKEAAQEEFERLQYELRSGYSTTEITRLREENARLNASLVSVNSLRTLPENMRETAELAGSLWGSKIAFTPKALDSAEDAACREQDALWTGLYHLAHTLWPLYFEEDLSQNAIKDAFGSTAAPWRLARGEGKMTHKDAKFARSRTDDFEGKGIYFETHISYGNQPPRLLRIHFDRDDTTRRIIIGHCGDHLDNYSSQKQ